MRSLAVLPSVLGVPLAQLSLDLPARRSRPLLQPPRLQFAAPRSLLKRAGYHPRSQVHQNCP